MTKLTQRAVLFLDMDKGGFAQHYEICDGDKVVGMKHVFCKKRGTKVLVNYCLGAVEFDNAADFVSAYEQQQ